MDKVTVTEADRDIYLQFIAPDWNHPNKRWQVDNGDYDEEPAMQAIAISRHAAMLEGVRLGLEAARNMALEWRDENKMAATDEREHGSMDMWRRFEGATTECNAFAHELAKLSPAAIVEGVK